jgi:multiple sugar transport system substrate-binding protein
MWEVAKRLTVDVNNNDATSPDFDPESIEQWGYEPTFQDLRAIGSYYGAGSLVAEDQTTAQLPEQWRQAWVDLYENTHTNHVVMTEAQRDAAEIGNENPFNAGRVAMTMSHLWYTCCVSPVDDAGVPIDPNWDIAVVPSYNGTWTSNFNADTFRIWGETEHPEEAFEVLTYLLGEASSDLLGIYGAMPARTADQDAFLASLEEKWTQGVNWQVAIDGLDYPDSPSFEAWVPNYQESFASLVSFLSVIRTDPDLDIEAEIDGFVEELQAIYDRAEE